MNLFRKVVIIIAIPLTMVVAGNHPAYAQEDYELDSMISAALSYDSLLLDELMGDSLSILDLIDSLLTLDYRYSTLMFRVAYISDIVNAGRDFGVSQYGFSTGISYYHKTGFFGDISGYWNSDIEPNYNPTTLSAGYMGNLGKKWSFIGSYDHYFYTNTDALNYPLTNSLSISAYFDIKYVSVGVDYGFLFGDETAHRLRPNFYSPITFNKVGFIDQIALYPSASMLLGNQNIYSINENYQIIKSEIQSTGPGGSGQRRYGRNTEALYDLIYEEEILNVFGIMNYSLALPVNFRIKNFTLSVGYYLNFPVALPGEDIDYSPNSYFNSSLLYSIPFRSKNK